jgi:superfamily I DNA and/or RNA helicase
MQLRPHIQNYDLSAEHHGRKLTHNLDISLFERLCLSGTLSTGGNNHQLPFSLLTIQRRMRHDIADLVRIPLYPKLEDHPTVGDYPGVSGMYHNLYWLNHSHRECGSGEFEMSGASHSNDFEVDMVTQLVLHLSKQGCYVDGDIAVITPYLGQLRKLRTKLQNSFSVQLAEKDEDDVIAVEELESLNQDSVQSIQRRPLTQSVRIATVSPKPSFTV